MSAKARNGRVSHSREGASLMPGMTHFAFSHWFAIFRKGIIACLQNRQANADRKITGR